MFNSAQSIMHVFLIDELKDGLVYLDPQESSHAFKVLRLSVGDAVVAIDGLGTLYRCDVIDASTKKGVLKVVSQELSEQRKPSITIAMAPTKSSDRFEWFVEKACEIGVDRITPVICERSERRKLNLDRTHKLISAACKQSGNPWFPLLSDPMSFKDFINSVKPGFIAHCHDQSKTPITQLNLSDRKECTVLIGPEGDFSNAELELALSAGWEPISLGRNRLRTETAALLSLVAITLKSSS
ncbi:MAG: RsmE family RNA methyltransferase [Bacteroidota bacterium]